LAPFEPKTREAAAICTSVCTPVDGAILAAIDGVTRALATADDGAIPELVAERRALPEPLDGSNDSPTKTKRGNAA
jgi:hypothetical protein